MSERTPDPSALQRLASDPAVSAWVDASAGSGKTKVLTDRVLALLLSGAAPHKVLCLTFTKSAAGEMANRIANRLSSWARLPQSDLVEDLANLSGNEPTGEEIDRARRLFARVQEAPGGVRIDTMHAFCQGVLQRFPVEARVPPHFDILDERDQRALLAQARDSLVLSVTASPDSALAQDWNRVLDRLSENTFSKLMEEVARNRGRLTNAQGASVAASLGVTPDLTPEKLRLAACRDAAFDRPILGPAAERLLGESKTIATLGQAILDWLATTPSERNFDAYSMALLTDANAPRAFGQNKLLKSDDNLRAIIRAEQERVVAVYQNIAKINALADTQALLTVAQELIRRYIAAKNVRSRLDYDDLIDGAAHLLVDPGAAWVHFKLDGGIDHVLVDEAQDTSPAQWQVIAGLIAEFFAGQGIDGRHRTFFAVGDPKQSIYGFQGADPAEFHRRRLEISAQCIASGQEWQDVPLNVSFRSAPPVLTFADAVFQDSGVLGLDSRPLAHYPHRDSAPGWIEVWPLAEEVDSRGTGDIWQVPREYDITSSAEEQLARTVAHKIKDLVDSGEVLAATGKPIMPGDIMVLVRRRRRFGSALVNALKRLDVPVAGLDRMTLTRQLVVKDLVAFGQFLLLPSDDLNLAALLKGPFFAWSEERLFALAHARRGRLWTALQEAGSAEDQADCQRLRAWIRRAEGLTPFAFYSNLLTAGRGREAIRQRLGPEADDPMNEFLALALSFPQHGPPTLQHFLHWLDADEIEIKREMEQGGQSEVRLLTVHAAKGLQAPIVFLPDAAFEPQPNKDALTWDGETPIWAAGKKEARDPVSNGLRDAANQLSLREENRLLYVALTRAEDRLYIGGWKTKRKVSPLTWYSQIHDACFGLTETGQMLGHDFALDGLEGAGFMMGEQPEPADTATTSTAAPIADLPYWALTPAPAEATPARPLAPSRPNPPPPAARSPLRDRTQETQRFRRGTLLHRLFQFLPGQPAHERLETAARVLADASLSDDELNAYVESAAKVLDDPAFAAIFGPDAMAEAPLTGLVDGYAVNGMVDRLLVTSAKVLVVDYKTNRKPPANPTDVPEAYLRQMQTYARLLAGIYPDREIQTALLWTEAPRLDIVAVPPSVN